MAIDVFISHSSKDAQFVAALELFLKVALRLSASQIRATSLEETQLPAGAKIDEVLRDEILGSKAFIAVISPTSLHSTYVLFELGARWGADKKMFPLLLASVDVKQISAPLNAFHIVQASRAGLWNLINNIGDILDSKPESPDSVQNLIDRLLNYTPATFNPLAFAVLSYVVDKKLNFALLKDSHYKKIQPPGRRLEANEYPDEVSLSVASEELDLPIDEFKRFPSFTSTSYERTRLVVPPYQVQVEKNPHRTALVHYDFVYVLSVDQVKPPLSVRARRGHKTDPQWYSLAEVKRRQAGRDYSPHEDMLPTMKKIVADFRGQSRARRGAK